MKWSAHEVVAVSKNQRVGALAAGLAIVISMACNRGGGPVTVAAAPERAQSAACIEAQRLRARVPGLLGVGRLDRSRRVIAAANGLCPRSATATAAEELVTLDALGLVDEANRCRERVRKDPDSNEALRAKAAAPPPGPPTATVASLVAAGRASLAAGNGPAAQRELDRALARVEREEGHAAQLVVVSPESGLLFASDGRQAAQLVAMLPLGQGGIAMLDAAPDGFELAHIAPIDDWLLPKRFTPESLVATGEVDGLLVAFGRSDLAPSVTSRAALTALSEDGRLLGELMEDGSLQVRALGKGDSVATVRSPEARAAYGSLEFVSPRLLLAYADASTYDLFDLGHGRFVTEVVGPSGGLPAMPSVSDDGQLGVVATLDGETWQLRLLDLDHGTSRSVATLGKLDHAPALLLLEGGTEVLVSYAFGGASVIDVASGTERLLKGSVSKQVAQTSYSGATQLRLAEDRRTVCALAYDRVRFGAAFCDYRAYADLTIPALLSAGVDASERACFARDGGAKLVAKPAASTPTRTLLTSLVFPGSGGGGIGSQCHEQLSADGRTAAFVEAEATDHGYLGAELLVVDTASGRVSQRVPLPDKQELSFASHLEFSADGSVLLVDWDGEAFVVNTRTGERVQAFSGFDAAYQSPRLDAAGRFVRLESDVPDGVTLFDVNRRALVTLPNVSPEAPAPTLDSSVLPSDLQRAITEQRVAAEPHEGWLSLRSLPEGQLLATIAARAGGRVVALLPGGYATAVKGGAAALSKDLTCLVGRRVVPVELCRERLFVEDASSALLGALDYRAP